MRVPGALLAPVVAALAFACHVAASRAHDSELITQRRRQVDAIDSERLRIQRDLHDTAQQRIISLRLRLGILAEDGHLDRSAVVALADDLDAALADIRAVTAATSPDLALRHGLPAALRSATARAPLPVLIDSPNFGRLAPWIERQVYFCCLEGLQNVFKHSEARHAWVRLRRQAGRLGFEVVDDGRGFDLSGVTIGQGLRNIAYRLGSLEGRLSVVANPGGGTRLRGEVPIAVPRPPGRRLLTSIQPRGRARRASTPRAGGTSAQPRRSGRMTSTARAASI